MKMTYLSNLVVAFLVLTTMFACKSFKPTTLEVSSYRFESNDDYDEDEDMEIMISDYRVKMVNKTQEVIGILDVSLTKQKPESTLGNFFTDIFYEEGSKLWESQTDFAIQNYGGLRRPSLPKGKLTVGHIYELMPFENYVTRIEGDSALIKTLLDKIALYGGWPISKQVRFEIQDKKAVNIYIAGVPLSNDRSYAFLLPDYIANGGDRFTFLKSVDNKEVTDLLIRDALIQNLKSKYHRQEHISAKIEGRIEIKE